MIRQETRHKEDSTSDFDTFDKKTQNIATKNIFYLLELFCL